MNCGFSNLTWLKKNLLAGTMQSDQKFDDLIGALGRGVAKQFEKYCAREFVYRVGIMEVFNADRSFWYTLRKPVSIFTKVELRYFRTDAWTDISGQPLATDEGKGYINFGYTLGRDPMQVRLTYNGGYYFTTLEKSDPGYLEPHSPAWFAAIPADIAQNAAGLNPDDFLLPDDLKLAWLLQVKHLWKNIDKLGVDTINNGEVKSLRFPEDAAPTVETTLQQYKRFALI